MTHSENHINAAMNGGANGFLRDGYDHTETDKLTASEVESATVYGPDDESIGSVNELQLAADGKLTGAIVDVGGFLGIGAHSVLLPFSQLTVLRKPDGSDVRIYLDKTKETLEAMPEYDG